MRLYSIRAYDKAEDAEPSRTYLISATNEDGAVKIFEETAYASQHERQVISRGEAESDVPGAQFWGYTSGGTMLKAPGH
jgi:hypothetical protein